MKTHQILVMAAMILILAAGLSAKHSDSFLIGAYSHIRSDSPYANCTGAIAAHAGDAGFNALRCTSVLEIDDIAPTDMFGILDSNSLDVFFEDRIFYPSPDPSLEKYGYSALSSGIDMKFEAEYANAADVNYNDRNSDIYFYMSSSSSRVGGFVPDPVFSNLSNWSIPNGTPGYAYKDITYRWPYGNHYDRVGKEFRFLGNTTNGVPIIENNKLNVRYVFRVDQLDNYSDSDPLAVFSFVKYSGMTTESTTYDSLSFYQGSNDYRKFVLTKGIYLSLPVFDMQTGCRALEFQFPLKDINGIPAHTLDNQHVISANGSYMQMSNLNPWMYWTGRGALRLDYIEYHDDASQLHQRYNQNSETAKL